MCLLDITKAHIYICIKRFANILVSAGTLTNAYGQIPFSVRPQATLTQRS